MATPPPAARKPAPGPAEPPAPAGGPRFDARLLDQLKSRNIVRVAVLYLVVCWVILEPVHVVFHMLEVPGWANRLVVILMAVGFPAVLLFAWAFEVTPQGLKPSTEVAPGRSIARLTGRRLDRAIIVLLALALGYFVVDKLWLSKTPRCTPAGLTQAPVAAPAAAAIPERSVAVLPFVNMSSDHEQEYFSDGLAEELNALWPSSRTSGSRRAPRRSRSRGRSGRSARSARRSGSRPCSRGACARSAGRCGSPPSW